jgi:hypothetical protein
MEDILEGIIHYIVGGPSSLKKGWINISESAVKIICHQQCVLWTCIGVLASLDRFAPASADKAAQPLRIQGDGKAMVMTGKAIVVAALRVATRGL